MLQRKVSFIIRTVQRKFQSKFFLNWRERAMVKRLFFAEA
jgi:hypothetical protein